MSETFIGDLSAAGTLDGTEPVPIEQGVGPSTVRTTVDAIAGRAVSVGAVPTSRTITAGAGLSGGGDLSANRTLSIPNAGITRAMLVNSVATSVMGRNLGSAGAPADIAASADGEVLRRASGLLGFGAIATAGITDAAVTYAKIQNVTSARLLGRSTAGAGVAEEISIGSGLALSAGTLSATGGGSGFTDNWIATSDPTAGDDTADGYAVGSRWLNTTTGITWTCASASAGAAVWFPHGSLDHPGYLSGRYYIPQATSGSSQAVVVNRLYASPMPVLHRAVLTGIAFRVNTLTAGNARVAIYANDAGRPGARIAQSSVTAKASGINILSITATLSPGFYWLAAAFSSTSSIFSWTQAAVAGSGMGFYNGADNAGGVSDIYATTSTVNAIYRTAALPDLTTDFPTPFATGSSFTTAAATGSPILGIAL